MSSRPRAQRSYTSAERFSDHRELSVWFIAIPVHQYFNCRVLHYLRGAGFELQGNMKTFSYRLFKKAQMQNARYHEK
jgi:hypothetical protein